MKKFIKPELSVSRFDTQDIITASGITTAADIVKSKLGNTSQSETVSWNDMNPSILD